MASIKLLPKSLQNQIAAGEVVERPASIIKELVENSIDAHATDIKIEIEEGGVKKIRVIDNGKGISPEHASLAFKRYATSKIEKVDDLFNLHSFGFRGEALASIASVSNMILKTKQAEDETGIECSPEEEPVPCALQNGTEIIVENLFWNVPARKKFLKSEATERREIFTIIEKFALSHPEISFSVKNNGKEKFSCRGRTTDTALFERCKEILGNSITDNFLPLQYDGIDISLSGFTTHPNFHRSNRAKQYIFVNNRMIDGNSSIYAAIMQSYETLLPRGKFPAFLLHIQIRPDEVDVNVHPRKTEVQFNSPSLVFKTVKGAFMNALENENISSTIENKRPEDNIQAFASTSPLPSFHSTSSTKRTNIHFPQNTKFSQSFSAPFPSFPSSQSTQNTFSDFLPKNENFEEDTTDWKIIGQARNSFILVEEPHGLRVVDQHAAHERVRLEFLQEASKNKKIISQPLLSPHIISVSLSEKEMLMEEKPFLQNAGFEIEDFGGNEISINAVPSGSEHINIEKLFSDLLADCDFFDSECSFLHNSFSKKAMSYTACRGAKMFGDLLSFPEMEKLISDWKKCKYPDSCAHGRPVSIFYPYKNLENECGRY